MTAWIQTRAIADVLGIGLNTSRRLGSCGIFGPPAGTVARPEYSRAVIEELAQRVLVDVATLPPTLVVRLGEPRPSMSDWRSHSGWTESAPESQRRNAARGDWRIRLEAPERYLLAAMVGPFVVGAWAITGFDTGAELPTGGGRFRYTVESSETARQLLEGRRWDIGGGWTAARCGATAV